MKFFYLLLFSCTLSLSVVAQNQRFIHRTYQLDTATILELDLFGEYTTETWVGDAVMIETKVSVANVPEGIFNHYIKEGRYEIEEQREGETLRLMSKDKDRAKIKTPKGDSEEIVTVKVFIPDVMQANGDKMWTKPKKDGEKE